MTNLLNTLLNRLNYHKVALPQLLPSLGNNGVRLPWRIPIVLFRTDPGIRIPHKLVQHLTVNRALLAAPDLLQPFNDLLPALFPLHVPHIQLLADINNMPDLQASKVSSRRPNRLVELQMRLSLRSKLV